MLNTVRAVVREGKIELLEPVDLPEGTTVSRGDATARVVATQRMGLGTACRGREPRFGSHRTIEQPDGRTAKRRNGIA